jgi:hypothetical protein
MVILSKRDLHAGPMLRDTTNPVADFNLLNRVCQAKVPVPSSVEEKVTDGEPVAHPVLRPFEVENGQPVGFCQRWLELSAVSIRVGQSMLPGIFYSK